MFDWMKEKLRKNLVKTQDQEISQFIVGIKGASNSQKGLILALTNHWRNILEKQYGWDLDNPMHIMMLQDITAAYKVVKIIKAHQENGPSPFITGLMTWLHTLRASITPELRAKAKEMWRELEYGRSYAQEAANDFSLVFGSIIDVIGIERIPINMKDEDKIYKSEAKLQPTQASTFSSPMIRPEKPIEMNDETKLKDLEDRINQMKAKLGKRG